MLRAARIAGTVISAWTNAAEFQGSPGTAEGNGGLAVFAIDDIFPVISGPIPGNGHQYI